ncbi:MAG: hypothetical protein ABI723_15735 [Bacteroidia bacterium]
MIKKSILTTVLVIAVVFTTQAQYVIGNVYPGYIVSKTGDTTQCFIRMTNKYSNQTRCLVYANETDRKEQKSYKPSELRSYKVADRLYEAIPYGDIMPKTLNFVLVEIDGHLRQYIWYSSTGDENKDSWAGMGKTISMSTDDEKNLKGEIVLRKPDEKVISSTKLLMSFSKTMSEYLSDYPELSAKIQNKEKGYDMLHVLQIVDEYNKWYASKAK